MQCCSPNRIPLLPPTVRGLQGGVEVGNTLRSALAEVLPQSCVPTLQTLGTAVVLQRCAPRESGVRGLSKDYYIAGRANTISCAVGRR